MQWAYRLNACLNAVGVGRYGWACRWKGRLRDWLAGTLHLHRPCLIQVNREFPLYVYTDSHDFRIYARHPFEPYTTTLFRGAVARAATVLDLGAQFGYFSLLAAQAMGGSGTVYAFEPVPDNAELLERNIRLHGYTSVIHAIQKAVGDRHATASLFVYEGTDSHAMYRPVGAIVKATVCVECVAVDDFLQGAAVDVIKMDIEGHEPYALRGMQQTIARSPRLILFSEFAPAYLRRGGTEPSAYLAQLQALGFSVQVVDEQARGLRPATSGFWPDDEPGWYTNLYCTKRS